MKKRQHFVHRIPISSPASISMILLKGKGTIHLRCRHFLGADGSKICQRWIVVKNCGWERGHTLELHHFLPSFLTK